MTKPPPTPRSVFVALLDDYIACELGDESEDTPAELWAEDERAEWLARFDAAMAEHDDEVSWNGCHVHDTAAD